MYVQMRRWKVWEKETQTTEYLVANGTHFCLHFTSASRTNVLNTHFWVYTRSKSSQTILRFLNETTLLQRLKKIMNGIFNFAIKYNGIIICLDLFFFGRCSYFIYKKLKKLNGSRTRPKSNKDSYVLLY